MFSLEAILIKWLVNKGVDGVPGSALTLLFDGIFGVILLIGLHLNGVGLALMPFGQILTIFVSGICTSLALALVNYAVANGIAGIAFSVANAFPAWHAIFNWLALGQLLSGGQIVGVLLAVSGSVVLSIPEKLDCFAKRAQSETDDY